MIPIFQQFRTMTANDTADMYTIVAYANMISNGILMPIMLLTIFMVSLLGMVFYGRPFHRALLFSSFICSILGILLVIMNMLNVNYVYLAFLMTGIGLVWSRLSEGQS
jgi:hypothetical protein